MNTSSNDLPAPVKNIDESCFEFDSDEQGVLTNVPLTLAAGAVRSSRTQ
jgi:hypothetical protein